MVNEDELRAIITEEFAKLHYPYPYRISSSEKFESRAGLVTPQIQVDISLRSPYRVARFFGAGESGFRIGYFPQSNEMAEGDIHLAKPIQGEGWGRKLVTMREDVARRIDCERIIVWSLNVGFWKHMGYHQMSGSSNVISRLEKRIAPIAPTLPSSGSTSLYSN